MKINFLLLIMLTLASINIQAFENNRVFKKVSKAPMIPKPGKGAGIEDLVFSPSEPNIVYALTRQDNSLYQSKNGGDQWEKVNPEGELQFKPNKLLVSASNSQILFATIPPTMKVKGYRLKRSTDGGKHWETDEFLFEHDLSIFNMPMTSLLRAVVLIDKDNSENKERRVATSSDAGETWQLSESVINDIDDKHIDILAIDPNNSHVVYGDWKDREKDQRQLYKSIDGGAHWSSIASSGTAYAIISELIIHPKNSNLLYRLNLGAKTGPDYQWFMSNDAGLNWQSIIAETWAKSVNLVIHPTDENILYRNDHHMFQMGSIYTTSNPLYKSMDSGTTWALVKELQSVNLLATSWKPVIVNPIDPDDLFAITYSSMARSQNGGLDWQFTQAGIESDKPGTMSTAPNDSMTLYFAAEITPYPSSRWFDPRYFKSVAKGMEWEQINIPEEIKGGGECEEFIINPVNSHEILCRPLIKRRLSGPYYTGRIIKSTDAGKTWALLKEINGRLEDLTYARDGKTIYAPQCVFSDNSYSNCVTHLNKLVKKENAWLDVSVNLDEEIISSLKLADARNLSIQTDPTRPKIAYLIQRGGNTILYKTIDAGDNWKKIIESEGYTSLLMNPKSPEQLIFIGEKTSLLTNDSGNSWTNFSKPSVDNNQVYYYSLIFNPKNSDGLFLLSSEGLLESRDLGQHWQLIKKDQVHGLHVKENNIFFSINDDSYQLTSKPYTTQEKDCLFNWAEQQYPILFSPALADAQSFEDYSYRYYTATNTYLGFFKDDEVHYLEASQSGDIKKAGFMEQYMHLAECI